MLMVEVQGIMVINNWFVLADGFMKAGWSVRDGTEENTSIELPFRRSQFAADLSGRHVSSLGDFCLTRFLNYSL